MHTIPDKDDFIKKVSHVRFFCGKYNCRKLNINTNAKENKITLNIKG